MTLSHAPTSAIATVAARHLTVARTGSVWALPDHDPAFVAIRADAKADLARKLGCLAEIHRSQNKTGTARSLAARYAGMRGYSSARLLALYYEYTVSGTAKYPAMDWRICLDKAMAGKAFWDTQAEALPQEFLNFVKSLRGGNKKAWAPAWRQLLRYWESGCDDKGKRIQIPGYGTWQTWWAKTHVGQPLPAVVPLPPGWSEDNLGKRTRPTKAQRKAQVQGLAAARKELLTILTTTADLLFLQEVQFDDVRTDWRVIDPGTGQVCDLWLLVAMDRASRVVLGFWMRPAITRADGSQEHFRLQDMKLFVGWVLERYGLPRDYVCTWVIENGTATLSDACAAALGGLFGDRVKVRFTRMLGGVSGTGYKERAVGNSKGKASLESSFRLLHNEGGNLPAQMGNRYEVRPADLVAREKEAVTIWSAFKENDADLATAKFPVLTLQKARVELNRIFDRVNRRTNHRLEGFEDIHEWRFTELDAWQPLDTFPDPTPNEYSTRKRKLSPYEKALQLIGNREWDRVPTATLVAFYQHTQTFVRINGQGEISFQLDGQSYTFRRPEGDKHDYMDGEKYLAYFSTQEAQLLHLTRLAPHEGYVGTWVRRDRIASGDKAGLAEQMRYVEGAVRDIREMVAVESAGERAELAEMRAHNLAVLSEVTANRAALDATGPDVLPESTVRDGQVARGISTARRAAINARTRAGVDIATTSSRSEDADDAILAANSD